MEEVNEYLGNKNLGELADVLEVLVVLAGSLGYTEEKLFEKRRQKQEERGGFGKVLCWSGFVRRVMSYIPPVQIYVFFYFEIILINSILKFDNIQKDNFLLLINVLKKSQDKNKLFFCSENTFVQKNNLDFILRIIDITDEMVRFKGGNN